MFQWPPFSEHFKDEWLLSARAVRWFLFSAISAVGVTAMFVIVAFGLIDGDKISDATNLMIGVVEVPAILASGFLMVGMWTFWIRLDQSSLMTRRLWLVALVLGTWVTPIFYYFLSYRPQVIRSLMVTEAAQR